MMMLRRRMTRTRPNPTAAQLLPIHGWRPSNDPTVSGERRRTSLDYIELFPPVTRFDPLPRVVL
jgi:hypothetical protein